MRPTLEPSVSLRIFGAVLTSQFGKVIDRTAGRVIELHWVAVAMLALGGILGPHAAGAETLLQPRINSFSRRLELDRGFAILTRMAASFDDPGSAVFRSW